MVKDCSSLGPFGAGVHPACNTQFEFDLSHRGHLDKNPNWQHAGEVLNRGSSASLKTVRFGIDKVLDWGSS
jgi:hypothetical protein